MSAKAVGVAIAVTWLSVCPPAQAQFSAFGSYLCPVNQIGQPCNQQTGGVGSCVPAVCEVTVSMQSEAGTCTECAVCVGYTAGSRYCSPTVACDPGVPCYSWGLEGMGIGPSGHIDEYLVLYDNTQCAPWLADAGPIEPGLTLVTSASPPWVPCATASGGADSGLSPSKSPAAHATPTSDLDFSTVSSSASGVDASPGMARQDVSASPQGPPEATIADASARGAPGSSVEYQVLGGACAIACGERAGGVLPLLGAAVGLGCLRRRRRPQGVGR